MSAVDFVIYQGASFEKKLTLSGQDLAGYLGVKAEIRKYPNQEFPVIVEFTAEITNPETAEITLSFAVEETAALDFGREKFYWDLFLNEPEGEWRRVSGGRVAVVPAVTGVSNVGAKDIVSVTFDDGSTASINEEAKTVSVSPVEEANPAEMIPIIVHTGRAIYPGPEAVQDFTSPVVYVVVAADYSIKKYTFSLE